MLSSLNEAGGLRVIAAVFFILWMLTVVLLLIRIEQVKKLKGKLNEVLEIY